MTVTKNALGYFAGRTLVAQSSEVGGARNVFVKLQGMKNELVFPTFGGQVKNPFLGAAKIYAGDLIEFRTDDNGYKGEVYILKTYEVVSVSGTTVNIARSGYHHRPFIGDKIGVAPEEIGGAMTSATVIAITRTKEEGKDVWALTMDNAITATAGDVLVEAGDDDTMVVKRINAVAPCDYDFLYSPVADPAAENEFEAARYFMTPALGGLMYTHKMSPMPECVKKLNTSEINGWFKVGTWGNF